MGVLAAVIGIWLWLTFRRRAQDMEGELRRVMAVIKMRGSEHTHQFRRYEVTASGVVVGGPLTEYDGIVTGVPTLRAKPVRAKRRT